ncbi:MAG: nucleoside-triphosphatase [bacterium]
MDDWQTTRKHLLLTGPPGCGKSTILVSLAKRLEGGNVRGFTTAEEREKGRRVGFKIRTLSGQEGLLSHVSFRGPYRVSRYGVDIAQFERLVLPELSLKDPTVEAFLIDEIGKMECFSQHFVDAVKRILRGPIPVIATIAAKGGGFISEVKSLPNVNMVQVTPANRDKLPEQIERWLSGHASTA